MITMILVCIYGASPDMQVRLPLNPHETEILVQHFARIDDGCGCTRKYRASKARVERGLCTRKFGAPIEAHLEIINRVAK